MTTVIIGATGTIGSCLARRLANEGKQVILVGRDESKLSGLGQELNATWRAVDFSSSDNLVAAISQLPQVDTITSFVNCIGSLLLKPAHLTSDTEFRDVVETNLFSAFATVRCAAKTLRSRGGSVVLMGSAAGAFGIANHEAIGSAKAGIEGLARSAAASYASQNIRVNVVSPGLVKTDLTRKIWESAPIAAASCDLHALGRLGEPEQIASLIAWLIAPENTWITGQVIGIDGGLSKLQPRKRVQA